MATFRGTRADRLAKPATARRRSEREQERHTFRSNGWSTTFDPQASPEYAKRHDLVLATFPPTLTGFNAFYEARRGRPSPRPAAAVARCRPSRSRSTVSTNYAICAGSLVWTDVQKMRCVNYLPEVPKNLTPLLSESLIAIKQQSETSPFLVHPVKLWESPRQSRGLPRFSYHEAQSDGTYAHVGWLSECSALRSERESLTTLKK